MRDNQGAPVTLVTIASIGLAMMAFPIWRYVVRVRRYRHRVTVVGLIGCFVWLGFTICFNLIWILGATAPVNGQCFIPVLMVLSRTFYTLGLILLYAHFIMKAQLLNRDGRILTKLQILSILLLVPVPIVGILMITEARLFPLFLKCVAVEHPTVVLIQGLLHVFNSFMPAISFMEQTYVLLISLPQVEKVVKVSDPFTTRLRLFFLIVFKPSLFAPNTGIYSKAGQYSTHSTSIATNADDPKSPTPLTMSETRSRGMTTATTATRKSSNARESHAKIIRLVRRVLLATLYSCLTTVILYALILSGVIALGSQVLYCLDGSFAWCWAIYASPLPQETGTENAFTRLRSKGFTSGTGKTRLSGIPPVAETIAAQTKKKGSDDELDAENGVPIMKTVVVEEPTGRSE